MTRTSETAAWRRRYQRALRKHLEQGSGSSLRPAERLGRQAVPLGMETLDVARIHERALTTLAPPGGSSRARQRRIERARIFFAEAVVGIEKTHPAALEADARADQLTRTLRRRTRETSAATRQLQQGIVRRRAAEVALKASGKRRARLQQQSGRLQARLRNQTRLVVSAQEAERLMASRRLQDEIAQTLLAIQVRLLTLKGAAQAGTKQLKIEIAETQRVVKLSARTIGRWAHAYGLCDEA